jgi:hypothetical protein
MFLAMNGLERVGSFWRPPRETSPLPPSVDNFHQDALLMPAACSAAWGLPGVMENRHPISLAMETRRRAIRKEI